MINLSIGEVDRRWMYVYISVINEALWQLVYGKSWPTADVRICHQRSTLTWWGLALIYCIWIMTQLQKMARPLSPRLLRNNSRPRRFNGLRIIRWRDDTSRRSRHKQTFSIRPEVLAPARRLDDAIDECYDNKTLEKATMQIRR